MVSKAKETRVGFVGAGRVANALAPALESAGFTVVAVSSRRPESAASLASRLRNAAAVSTGQDVADTCDLIFLTVPDDAITALTATINWRPDSAVVHTSGALPREALVAAAKTGAATASLHPLQTFAAPSTGDNADAPQDLTGVFFALEAEAELRDQLLALVDAIGGSVFELRPKDRVLYHASAVMVSNYVVTLVKLASDLWRQFDRDQDTAVEALLPLLRTTVANIENRKFADVLTGPVARGDARTIASHLAVLSSQAPQTEEIYRRLAIETIPLALAQGGLGAEDAKALRRVLQPEGFGSADLTAPAARK